MRTLHEENAAEIKSLMRMKEQLREGIMAAIAAMTFSRAAIARFQGFILALSNAPESVIIQGKGQGLPLSSLDFI